MFEEQLRKRKNKISEKEISKRVRVGVVGGSRFFLKKGRF